MANFIEGYAWGRNRTNLGLEDDLMWFRAFYGGFDEFVSKKIKLEVTHPWYKKIEFACLSDPECSVNTFYEMLDEFLSEVGDATADDIPDPHGWKNLEVTPIELPGLPKKSRPHFFGALDIGRKYPAMLLGSTLSLTVLAQTIRGYVAGRDGTDLGIDDELKRFIDPEDGFDKFVARKFGIDIPQTWDMMIEFMNLSNPSMCVEAFYKLLDEFLDSNSTTAQQ